MMQVKPVPLTFPVTGYRVTAIIETIKVSTATTTFGSAPLPTRRNRSRGLLVAHNHRAALDVISTKALEDNGHGSRNVFVSREHNGTRNSRWLAGTEMFDEGWKVFSQLVEIGGGLDMSVFMQPRKKDILH